jgi:hypothetical protein
MTIAMCRCLGASCWRRCPIGRRVNRCRWNPRVFALSLRERWCPASAVANRWARARSDRRIPGRSFRHSRGMSIFPGAFLLLAIRSATYEFDQAGSEVPRRAGFFRRSIRLFKDISRFLVFLARFPASRAARSSAFQMRTRRREEEKNSSRLPSRFRAFKYVLT